MRRQTFDDLFQWTAKSLGVSVDPALPLPVVVRLPLKDLQALHPESQSGRKTLFGLYVNTPTPTIYVAKEAEVNDCDCAIIHEIAHYFQFRYSDELIKGNLSDYLKDYQLVDGQIPDN